MSSRSAGLLMILLLATSCQKQKKDSAPKRAELEELSNGLRSYRFKKDTPDTLSKLLNLAKRSKGDMATEAWFKVARGHLDWFLVALKASDGSLMKSLFDHLGMPSDCCKDGRCVSSLALQTSDACREKLLKILSKEFEEVKKGEEGQGGYAKLSGSAQTLLKSLLILSKNKDDAFYGSFVPLIHERDPIATRARLATMLFIGESLSAVAKHPPHKAPLMLGYLVPYPCPGAFRHLLKTESPLAVQRLLMEHRCAYTCKGLTQLPMATDELFKAVTKDCAFDQLGFKKPSELSYFTQPTFIALKAARFLSAIASYLPEERGDPVMKLNRPLARQFLRQLSDLRIRLPYPATMKLGDNLITPPKIASIGGPPIRTVAHIAVGAHSRYLGLIPTLGFSNTTPRLLDALTDHHLPGKKLPVPLQVKGAGPVTLDALLRKARGMGHAMHPAVARSKWSDWVGIYADHKLLLKELKKTLAQLKTLMVPAVQIFYISDLHAGSASHAVSILLGEIPKEAVSLADKDFQPQKPTGVVSTKPLVPVSAFSLNKANEITMDMLVKKILDLKKEHPKARFYLGEPVSAARKP